MQAANNSPKLSDAGIKRVQRIAGALFYYARAVGIKLLVALSTNSAISSQQTAATEMTSTTIKQILEYITTYPDDGLVFRASGVLLSVHSDTSFNNESRLQIRAGAHIYLSEEDAKPRFNGAITVISIIMKNVMPSAAEAELGALFECARAMVPLRQALIKMG